MGAYLGTVRRSFSKDLAVSSCDIICEYFVVSFNLSLVSVNGVHS